MHVLSVIFLLLCLRNPLVTSEVTQGSNDDDVKYWDYIVIGAGPAGLQMGHFLKKANRNYIILERSNISGMSMFY